MWKSLTQNLHRPVFIPSLIIIISITLACVLFPTQSQSILSQLKNSISELFGWFYIFSVSLFILFLLLISGSRLGDIKLGNDGEPPEYPFVSWFAMLFASGMGIGLMYFGVAEPISHYLAFQQDFTSEIDRTKNAIVLSFYHWGVHAWAIYAVMGLALAYFGFRYKKPLTIRSGFYPILKEHSNKMCGDVIDIVALFSTVFGICTSLGFGALQINAGLVYLGFFDENNIGTQITIIIVMMVIVAISTLLGVSKGMKRISEINLLLALLLLVLVVMLGPTIFLLAGFTENMGDYLKSLIELSFRTFAYDNEKQDWITGWTVLYWAWWLSWTPFVGLFIAKISKGRTVREFILGVLFIPSLFNFLWMSIFGNSAIWFDQQTSGEISKYASETSSLIFHFFEHYPISSVLSIIAIVVIALFFITSADSGVNVINSISSKGYDKPTRVQNLFWVILMITLSCALLYSGGLSALQTMTLIITLPFCLIMLVLCIGVWKGLLVDNQYFSKKFTHSSRYWKGKDWREQLNKVIVNFTRQDVTKFIQDIAKPAFHLFALELKSYGVSVTVESDEKSYIALTVNEAHKHSFSYGIRCEKVGLEEDNTNFDPMTYFSDGRLGYDVKFMHQDELITDILRQYELYLSLSKDKSNDLITEEIL